MMTKTDSTKNLIFDNPLLRRYRCSLLRPSQLWIFMIIYIIVVSLFLFVNYNIHQLVKDSFILENFFNDLYYQFAALQILILCVWAPLNSRSALKQEIFEKTYDFFRLLPLSALQKTLGVIIGRNILALLFAAMTFVPIIVFGVLGKVSASLQLQVILLLFSSAVFLNSAALLSFNTAPGRQKKTSIGVWIVLFIFFGPFLIHFLFLPFYAMSKIPDAEDFRIKFYCFEFLILVFISLVMLYFTIWNVIGNIRKFNRENEPLFSRIGACLFILGYYLLVLGLFLPHMLVINFAVYYFWLAISPPVLLIPLGSMRTFEDYLESCSLAGRPDASKSAALLKSSNLTLAFVLFVIWLCFSVFAAVKGQLTTSLFVTNLAVLFSFCLFLILLLELYVVYRPLLSKIGLLLCFFTGLYFFLPIIFSFTLQVPSLRYYSLWGFFSFLLNPLSGSDEIPRAYICIVNVLLSIAPAVLIAKRYSRILKLSKSTVIQSKK